MAIGASDPREFPPAAVKRCQVLQFRATNADRVFVAPKTGRVVSGDEVPHFSGHELIQGKSSSDFPRRDVKDSAALSSKGTC